MRRDRSAIDFAIACRLVEAGRTETEVAAVIRSAGHDAKGGRPEYIARTIAAARRRVQHPLPSAGATEALPVVEHEDSLDCGGPGLSFQRRDGLPIAFKTRCGGGRAPGRLPARRGRPHGPCAAARVVASGTRP